MERTSLQLKDYKGPNPFHEGQAKAFTDRKLIEEFFPTSTYWSRFNGQHEVLIGTRGSGKTAILKMLSYSWLRALDHQNVSELLREKKFIGFYMPLHLEFIASLPGQGCPDDQRLQYFNFAFNCAAIKALVREISALLTDCFPDPQKRLTCESNILTHLFELWFPGMKCDVNSVFDLQWKIDVLYHNQPFWRDGELQQPHIFATSLFWPITPALSRVAMDLGLNPDSTVWIACLDEAEFLTEPFICSVNTFLRSEKKPLVIKLATLPFRHLTKRTTAPSASVEGEGNDFNYRVIDLEADSSDFRGLSDALCRARLKKCGINDPHLTLETFLGSEGNNDLIDYFRLELPEESSEDHILQGILDSISEVRRVRFELIKNDPARVMSDYYKKFAPVYYFRRMQNEDRRGNRTVGWFAGAKMLRRISDGNPRRFIQLMNDLFEAARNMELTPKNQHRIAMEFCRRHYEACEGLPDYGVILKHIIAVVGKLLELRVHGEEMQNAGNNFFIQSSLLGNPVVRSTLELGLAYSIIFTDHTSITEGLHADSELRLANMLAAEFWLPMQKGGRVVLQSKHTQGAFPQFIDSSTATTARESKRLVDELQLDFSDSGDT
jgi:hypothetical protein